MGYQPLKLKDFRKDTVLQFTGSDGSLHTVNDAERQQTEVYSRVMGYYRPISIEGEPQWNPGKIAEHNERVWFKMPKEAQ